VLIELVDDLRCPRAHDETWLVASAVRTEGRDILEGTLGCPICYAEYPIREGAVFFDDVERNAGEPAPVRDSGLAMRLAALLDLSDPRGFGVFCGVYAPLASVLRGLVPPHLIALNPTPLVTMGEGISTLIIREGIPLAGATCRGVALDAAHADAAHVEAAVRVLQPRGRLVAPATTPLPPGVSEMARDDQFWVAERSAGPPRLVTLRARA
jgi:uncharacterized protein YbaR (Trm112 family)